MFCKNLIRFSHERHNVEIHFFVEQSERIEFAKKITAEYFVRAPIPIGRQDRIVFFCIVPDRMMDSTCAARGSYRFDIRIRFSITECQINDRIKIRRKSRDRRIANELIRRYLAIRFLYNRDTSQFFIIVHIGTDRCINDLVFAYFFNCLICCRICTKNIILRNLAFCMVRCHTHHHTVFLLIIAAGFLRLPHTYIIFCENICTPAIFLSIQVYTRSIQVYIKLDIKKKQGYFPAFIVYLIDRRSFCG